MDTLNIIINLMSEKKITQKSLTDYLGLNKGSFSEWKMGRNSSYFKYISQIAEFLNVSADYLLNKTDNPNVAMKTKSPTMQMLYDIADGKILIEESPATERSNGVSDDDIKFALFEGSEDITDEMYDEVKRFAQYIKDKKNKKV